MHLYNINLYRLLCWLFESILISYSSRNIISHFPQIAGLSAAKPLAFLKTALGNYVAHTAVVVDTASAAHSLSF